MVAEKVKETTQEARAAGMTATRKRNGLKTDQSQKRDLSFLNSIASPS